MHADNVWHNARLATLTGSGLGIVEHGTVAANNGRIVYAGPAADAPRFDATDFTAARWTRDKQEPAGFGTGTLPASRFEFRPLMGPHGLVGVCGIEHSDERLDLNAERALTAILDQTAIAMDRARLSEASVAQAARLEGERYREALLSSISHDLKTPLATITGAVTSLRELGDKMSPESRDDLLQSIEEEGSRMSRFVANLLDMTRIEAGTIQPKQRRFGIQGKSARHRIDRHKDRVIRGQ